MSTTPLVHVVDDDAGIRESLGMLLESVGMQTRTYGDADAFLARFRETSNRPTLVLLDVRMPGISGMTLLEQLRATHPALPVILMTGHGDIEMAVRAMKLGARDFIVKPFAAQDLLDRVQAVLRRPEREEPQWPESQFAASRLQALTRREREVFDRIVRGDANKTIALDLGISVRTVESHRARIMTKTGAKTLVDLVLLSVGVKPPHP
ncbi:MAG: response regulator [Thiohalocapsa sp.]|nr:response regulator [Thiohalocapsa sp.]MCF7989543.1 response regulator [Thiohalocapsa sp.]